MPLDGAVITRTDHDYENLVTAIRAIERREAKSIRKAAGMTQEDIGRALGVSQVAVFHWENGTRMPQIDTAIAYGKLLSELQAKAITKINAHPDKITQLM